jgi:thiamine pyrophosphate-dependent acetolactate synthase large subunit-like protein
MDQVLRHIRAARRPVLLVGGGCVGCDEELLNELVDVLGVPVVYTFMGKVRMKDKRVEDETWKESLHGLGWRV